MNNISDSLNTVIVPAASNFFTANYRGVSNLGVGLGGITGIVAAEMAIRAVGNLMEGQGNVDKNEFSNNLAGALFYGLCATNYIPHTAVAGGVVFAAYSLGKWGGKNNYVCTEIFNRTLKGINDYILKPLGDYVITPLIDHVLTPIWNNVVTPTVKGIANIAGAIFNLISLPTNPAWYGVAILGAAAIAKYSLS